MTEIMIVAAFAVILVVTCTIVFSRRDIASERERCIHCQTNPKTPLHPCPSQAHFDNDLRPYCECCKSCTGICREMVEDVA